MYFKLYSLSPLNFLSYVTHSFRNQSMLICARHWAGHLHYGDIFDILMVVLRAEVSGSMKEGAIQHINIQFLISKAVE